MPLLYVTGDLFTSPSQTLVNPVNTVGVMGKGLAAAFKKCYPDMYRKYRQKCQSNEIAIGKLWLYHAADHAILNFPTKQHWRSKSRLDYVEAGLQTFTLTFSDMGITSIAFPKLGCGLGGLDWETQVKPLMEAYLSGLSIGVEIYLS